MPATFNERDKPSVKSMDMDPEIPEGINVSKTHPLADFGLMLAGVLVIILLVFFAANTLAGVAVKFISFDTESALFEASPLVSLVEDSDACGEHVAYLQGIGDRLIENMNLPDDMQVTIHYVDQDIPNAFATLGGHVVIYQGLIDRVSSENGLAMVIAHEIAHIKHRDPILALGRGVVSLMGLLALTGFGESSALESIAGTASLGVTSSFSRSQENRADVDAIAAMEATYGTLVGADEFFVAMQNEHRFEELDFFSTHPHTQERMDRIRTQSHQQTHSRAELVDLPEFIKSTASPD